MEESKLIYRQKYNDFHVAQLCIFADGVCEIVFSSGFSKRLNIICDAVYCSQYGVPLSNEGDVLFFSSWENGLIAYNICAGKTIWQYKKSRITKVFVFGESIVAIRSGYSVVKLDIYSGAFIGEIKSATIEDAFRLNSMYLLINSIRGKIAIIDGLLLTVYKSYTKQTVNPNHCLSLIIQNAYINDNYVHISGFEKYPNFSYTDNTTKNFHRVLDWGSRTGDGSLS